jgi:hypothetical protein
MLVAGEGCGGATEDSGPDADASSAVDGTAGEDALGIGDARHGRDAHHQRDARAADGAGDALDDASVLDASTSDTSTIDGPLGVPDVVCASSGMDGAGAPFFQPAGPWSDAALCDASAVLPANPYTCCSASYFIPIACVPYEDAIPPDGATGLACQNLCGASAFSCSLALAPDGSTGVACQNFGCLGRRPEGLVERDTAATSVGAALESAYALEAASVAAFRTLRAELRSHGAPKSLLRSASRAAREERRHARVTRSLALRRGGVPRDPEVGSTPRRSLEALAIENAVEGCVRELFGALVARFQAEHARDADVRAVMARIADDELRHTTLAWRVAAWTRSRLSPAARARVAASRARAVDELLFEVDRPAHEDVACALGWPTPKQARALVQALERLVASGHVERREPHANARTEDQARTPIAGSERATAPRESRQSTVLPRPRD